MVAAAASSFQSMVSYDTIPKLRMAAVFGSHFSRLLKTNKRIDHFGSAHPRANKKKRLPQLSYRTTCSACFVSHVICM